MHPGRDVLAPQSTGNEDGMIDPGTSADRALDGRQMDADDPKAAKKLAKAAKKEKSEEGKSAEREQKLRWDAGKIQLKGYEPDRARQLCVRGRSALATGARP
jgi:hypothetical protein